MRKGTKQSILSRAMKFRPSLTMIRRDIHKYPELSFEETRTAELVAGLLNELGLEVQTGVAKTGVVGLLRGKRRGKTIAIRADIDALPIQEKNKKPYASRNKGAMHACGHDAHITCAVGAAMLLVEQRNKLRGNVKFIFQPSEELPPGGAEEMIKEGVLSKPKVDAIIGLHTSSALPAGTIGLRSGPCMASMDTLNITIKGKSSHGALPHLSVDAIAVAAQVIQALQTVVSRQTDPLDSVVVSIGKIEGGHAHNIIAAKVQMTGTVRTLDPAVQSRVHQMIEKVVRGVTASMGAGYKIDYELGYPMVVNDEGITNLVGDVGRDLLGAEKVIQIKPSTAGEDFACFLQRVPGCFFFLGIRNERKGIIHPWHHPEFDIDEKALPIGAAILAQTAVNYF